ncbi:hypothetical protein BpHYR1_004877 [Brachionus plicatilis]|uniref:Uncharacterized protein n=1 Tax=Brachionus plicatilis TaxID=10195 RepID=A0A3M7T5I2_BRAPC|nr:hypothetical protein BpHYR1_004877 [Brachionus plicatilis]
MNGSQMAHLNQLACTQFIEIFFLICVNSANLIEPMAKTYIGEKAFGFFYSRLINSFLIKRSTLKYATFKLSIFNNINLIFINFFRAN